MAELDLEEKYIEFIRNTILSVLPDCEIFIYGSRTQGKALKYSDVDISLKCTADIPIEKLLKIKADFQNSTFPYNTDFVDLNFVNKEFLNTINNDLYKIN